MTGKILWVDTETTGVDPKKNGIIQAGFIIEINGKVQEEVVFKMNPEGCEISEEAMRINCYTPEMLASYESETKAKKKIESLFEKYVDRYNSQDKFIAAGYNVGFDVDFLAALFSRCGDVYFRSWIDAAQLDVMRMQAWFEWTGKTKKSAGRKLRDIGAHWGCIGKNTHDALDDIRLTREIAIAMIGLEEE